MKDGRQRIAKVGTASGSSRIRSEIAPSPGKSTLAERVIPASGPTRERLDPAHATSTQAFTSRDAADKGIGSVDTLCIGEDFARNLSTQTLVQMIARLLQRRAQHDLAAVDRAIVLENLAVLSSELARREESSDAIDRDRVQTLLHKAVVGAQDVAGVLQNLAANRDGLRSHPVTEPFLEHAVDDLTRVIDIVNAGTTYLELATNTGDDAGTALLDLAATRVQAALAGLAILRPWCAFLQLHDRVAMLPLLQLEYRYRVLDRGLRGVRRIFALLTGFEADSVALARATVPEGVAVLASAFDEVVAETERAETVQRRAMQLQLVAELATFAGSLRGAFAMRGPPSATSFATPGITTASGGAATMGQVVVSAEWLAAIRHLVEIGAITAASAAEALRVRGFTSAMAQTTDLPRSVKDLLGEGPTTDAMKVTNTTGAGAAREPRHHVLPQEDRAFFEQRGFVGDLDIDNFTVKLDVAHHQAQHGGGSWRMGRAWPGEWNQLVRTELRAREEDLGRRLRVAEIMREIERLMKRRGIPLRFVPYRGE